MAACRLNDELSYPDQGSYGRGSQSRIDIPIAVVKAIDTSTGDNSMHVYA